jgi:hypothetical protein
MRLYTTERIFYGYDGCGGGELESTKTTEK